MEEARLFRSSLAEEKELERVSSLLYRQGRKSRERGNLHLRRDQTCFAQQENRVTPGKQSTRTTTRHKCGHNH